MVGAGDESAQTEVLVAFGEQVAIEQDFLGAGAFFAAVDGVLFSFFGARVVEVFVALHGNAQVSLLDAAEHFRVERGLQGFGVVQLLFGVSVLGFKVGDGVGIFAIAQPEIVVDAGVAVDGHRVRNDFRDGGHGKLYSSDG